jgi:hypothetical protein
MADVNYLPDEMIFEVMSFLSSQDIIRASATCSQFLRVSKNSQLWTHRLMDDWIHITDNQNVETSETEKLDDPRAIYVQRMTDLTHWSSQFAKISNYKHITIFGRLWIGLKPIHKILFHSLPTSFLLPKHLNRHHLGNHLSHIHFLQRCTRGVLTLFSLVSVLLILIFFLTHVSITYRLIALLVGILLCTPSLYDSFKQLNSHNSKILSYNSGILMSIYVYILICVLQLNTDLEHIVSFTILIGFLLYINGFLVAMDISVSLMLFGTINVKIAPGDAFKLPGSGLFLSSKGENAILDYEKEAVSNISRLPVIPLAVLTGLAIGTGGFLLLVELVILVIISIISWLIGNTVRISGGFESIATVLFASIYSGIVVLGTVWVLEHKMAYCWLLNRDRKKMSVMELLKRGGKLALWQILTLIVFGIFIYSWSFVLANTTEMIIFLPFVGSKWREIQIEDHYLGMS